MNFIREYTPDTAMISLPSSNKIEEKYLDNLLDSKKLYLLCWDNKTQTFTKNKKISPLLKDRSLIASKKYEILKKISTSIEYLRNYRNKSIPYQKTIYLSKKIQAERFKDKMYPENEILEYPYVLQYADFKKISLRESADMILLKARLDDEMLANTELLRLKYFNKIKEANSEKELISVYEQFLLDYDIRI